MKPLLKYRPDLRDCELEDRLVPANANLGATVLTTGGYVLLLSPFPVIASSPFGASGGPGFLTPSAMSGSASGSGVLPGNSPGVLGLTTTATNGSNGGASATIVVGSGADDAQRPHHPACHAQHHRQRRPPCRTCYRPVVGRPIRRLAARAGLSGRRAGDRSRWRLDEGAKPAGRVATG